MLLTLTTPTPGQRDVVLDSRSLVLVHDDLPVDITFRFFWQAFYYFCFLFLLNDNKATKEVLRVLKWFVYESPSKDTKKKNATIFATSGKNCTRTKKSLEVLMWSLTVGTFYVRFFSYLIYNCHNHSVFTFLVLVTHLSTWNQENLTLAPRG